ncbi:MAG TPA: EAL domain-containing protein [Bacillota bacterium]|nr:EAL domain-containing protein [Bacillota bacterium]
MKRKLLIADDSEINRQILQTQLNANYDIFEACDGIEALQILTDTYDEISVVLLDINMPNMNGYEVLQRMNEDDRMCKIPVIVMTGDNEIQTEAKVLELGAIDFILKPFQPEIIKRRIMNTIHLRETAAEVNAIRNDPLTGLLNRAAFFDLAGSMIADHEPGYYCMACYDINHFKVINDQYGTKMGDAVLIQTGEVFEDGFAKEGGIVCRIMADHFAVLFPVSLFDTDVLTDIRKRASTLDGQIAPIHFTIGRYIVSDIALPVSAMYDRAMLASASAKGSADENIATFTESMRESVILEQRMVSEANNALVEKQFEVWLQPQYNHSNGALVGAEALVRWRHPERGLISPGLFIPLFEKNGFIYRLDKFVWEETCRLLRKWIDEDLHPVPVSVNISRNDVYHDDLVPFIIGLLDKYHLPVDLLRLEITESAFAKSGSQVISVVKELVDYGFTMEIDDFGSGYSSLNTLKDVPAQVLKLDMRFLEGVENTSRGGNIIESVIRMAKWINMSVIAEGVETIEQANYLTSIGCSYIQGYLYSKPLPVAQYEQFAQTKAKEVQMLAMQKIAHFDNISFWEPASIDTFIFNSFVGGAMVFEYQNGKCSIVRVNSQYVKIILGENGTVEEALKLDWLDYCDESVAHSIISDLNRAIDDDKEINAEVCLLSTM